MRVGDESFISIYILVNVCIYIYVLYVCIFIFKNIEAFN